ncbi:hypothetical protein QOZ80_6BG0501620 [Eleusine coracana subsp. coracana]|nr:hypothetical protein QOZ80_6BG0501620 [Eleusine coracana subsp. coracana]
MQIFLQTLAGKTIPLDVEASDTVESEKAQIQEKEGIPVGKQRLVVGGTLLQDSHVLTDYDNIRDECTLRQLQDGRRLECMQIFVKALSGKILALVVESYETVAELKEKIQDIEGTPVHEQRLVYGARQLVEDHKHLVVWSYLLGGFLS